MNAAAKYNRSTLLVVTTTLTILFGCERGSDLSNTARANFFTDRRPFDIQLIEEDISGLTDAISSHPRDSRLLVARGFIYAALNEFDDAIADLERAADIEPNTDTADRYGPDKNSVHYLLALAYWQGGAAGEAIAAFSKVLSANPEYSPGYYYRGMAKLAVGDTSGAINDIEQAKNLGNKPHYAETLQQLRGQRSRGRILATYVSCFHPNKAPQSRPFGYVWEITHEVK